MPQLYGDRKTPVDSMPSVLMVGNSLGLYLLALESTDPTRRREIRELLVGVYAPEQYIPLAVYVPDPRPGKGSPWGFAICTWPRPQACRSRPVWGYTHPRAGWHGPITACGSSATPGLGNQYPEAGMIEALASSASTDPVSSLLRLNIINDNSVSDGHLVLTEN